MTWTQRVLNATAWIAACGGAFLAITAMAKHGTFSLALLCFGSWVLLPFGVSLLLLIKRQPSAVGYLFLTGASLFGAALYFDLAFPSSKVRSTVGLAFIFIPLWQFVPVGIASIIPGFRSPSRSHKAEPGESIC